MDSHTSSITLYDIIFDMGHRPYDYSRAHLHMRLSSSREAHDFTHFFALCLATASTSHNAEYPDTICH
jgi:hypothetical protein